MSDQRAVQRFGANVLIGVDLLFWFSLLFIYARERSKQPEWPDAAKEAFARPALAFAFLGCLAAAALLHRFTRRMTAVFVATVAALAAIAAFWYASAAHGLTPKVGRYGAVVYFATVLLAVHALGALIAAGRNLIARRDCAQAPLLGRFLAVLTAVTAVVLVAVLVW